MTSLLPHVPAEVGESLEAAVQTALSALEKLGISARDADEFVRECVFNAWWDWDYEGPFPQEDGDSSPRNTPVEVNKEHWNCVYPTD